ncbi:flavin reductase family protein [Gordonia paraffinivorans]|uniref:Flavin-dependent monooxygenase, reductase subunit HsaB n=2 Tax=Gordonia paraffinivorans TaxID=175628 RepID=A0ABD7V695_9ACTN|nr:flavin reductase family protein [Gordonia paraffinivorans]VFA89671.1 Flavin-dependent monooxygenase, reductase subunit HsaB [Gordonia paraffinivorans]
MTAADAIDGQHMRRVLGHFATGVVAVTGIHADTGAPVGLAANSFTSVSLDPPLVAFCVGKASTSWPLVRQIPRFSINILAEDQEDVCRRLATKGADKFRGLSWDHSPGGAPILAGGLAWIEAELADEHEAGDHTIVVARVRHLEAFDRDPLLFFRGGYGRIATDRAEVRR